MFKILTKGNDCVDDLKKAIDLKQMIESAFQKYKDLKIMPNVQHSGNFLLNSKIFYYSF